MMEGGVQAEIGLWYIYFKGCGAWKIGWILQFSSACPSTKTFRL